MELVHGFGVSTLVIHLSGILRSLPGSHSQHAVTNYHSRPANKAMHLQHLAHDFPTDLANLFYFLIGTGFEHGDTKGTWFDVFARLRRRACSKGKWTDGLW